MEIKQFLRKIDVSEGLYADGLSLLNGFAGAGSFRMFLSFSSLIARPMYMYRLANVVALWGRLLLCRQLVFNMVIVCRNKRVVTCCVKIQHFSTFFQLSDCLISE